MDAGSIALGFLIGAAVFETTWRFSIRRSRAIMKAQGETITVAVRKLTNLRRNAFLTNEHGHRVRYHKASAEVRARAEAGE